MKSILITGTSSGIGRATALTFAEHGFRVFAGARKSDQAPVHPNIVPILLDVTDHHSIEEAYQEIYPRTKGQLHALVNNAGTNLNGAFEYTSLEDAKALFDLNYWGPVQLSTTFLPLIRNATSASWSGKILTIGSIGSVAAVPWMAHYHGTKFGILGTMEALRHETHSLGIKVSVVLPGGVKTNFQEKTAISLDRARKMMPTDAPPSYRKSFDKFARIIEASSERGSDPELIARTILKTVNSENPRFKVVVGADARLIHALKRCLPESAFLAIYRKLFA